ncbi:hypothetical protein ANN_25166 [Periplaneta americana]|uniref:Uncharacterized protein n=1 Tax=Periplaneta americana TaxID=6978 RepID=A0ABQ8S0Q2_PERAM|nr:hypothetical protein ANN_25166 [Periplaneta americana]
MKNYNQRIPNLTGPVDNNDITLQRNRNKTAGRIDGYHGGCDAVYVPPFLQQLDELRQRIPAAMQLIPDYNLDVSLSPMGPKSSSYM